jgi:hypothetical protein
MQRLHIHEITSIGAVVAGDNDPDNDTDGIMLWKSRSGAPSYSLSEGAPPAGGKGHTVSRSLSPVDRATAVVKSVMAKLDEQDAAIRDIADSYRRIGETMTPRKAEIAPADTIRGKVDAIALEMVAKGEAPNLTQARPMVWKSRPDLVEASRAEPGKRIPGTYGGRAPDVDTVPERIAAVVKERADEMAGVTEWWNLTDAERRVIVWKSRQGKQLRAAYTDAMKRGETKFTKSNDHPEAMKILKSWEDDPSEGLR